MVFYIENLTLFSFLFQILPKLLRSNRNKGQPIKCLYINSTNVGHIWKSYIPSIFNFRILPLEFQYFDALDENGINLNLRTNSEDLSKFLKNVVGGEAYQTLFQKGWGNTRLPLFLTKAIALNPLDSTSLYQTLYLIQIVSWHMRQNDIDHVSFSLTKRCWMKELEEYSKPLGISLVPTFRGVHLKTSLVAWLYRTPKIYLLFKKIKHFFSRRKNNSINPITIAKAPKIVIRSINNFHLQTPTNHSEAFFWHCSSIPPKNILFYTSVYPLTDIQWKEVNEAKMNVVALGPQATQLPQIPVFSTSFEILSKQPDPAHIPNSLEQSFLQHQITEYNYWKNYWLTFFKEYNGKVFVSQFKYDNSHIVIADALKEFGGIATMWQQSHEESPSPLLATGADVMFGFSQKAAQIEQGHGSQIPYYITIGYPGDYRFPLLQNQAQQVRSNLKKCGVQKIIAYFDENSSEEGRYSIHHSVTQHSELPILEM